MFKSLRVVGAALVFTQCGFIEAAMFDALEYRNVGPGRGGRVTAVTGTVVEPGTFYLGASGGGVWKTTDYGTRWDNVSDGFFPTPSIGDISVSQTDPNVVYVGTGSDGLRSNVIPGKGVYKSIDAGESWTSIGLESVGQIGAVEIDPRNNNVVWVAAIGQAFNANPDRGVYKTINGGESWSKVLGVSDTVGFADLDLVPHNPDVILATAWRAERKPWTIISGGSQEEGGMYKSMDGGESWRRISKGLPTGLIGKIDLAVSPADSRIVYALVEAPGDDGGMYKSVDQGESFVQVSSEKGIRNRPFYYGNVEADPRNPDVVYVMAGGYWKSVDGGETWARKTSPHGDNHDMWINPNDSDLFIQSNDGGANVTHNGGATWSTQFNQPTTELYQVEVDDQYPYWLYAGQQDNGSTIAVPSRAPFRVQSTDAWLIETGGCETGPAVPKPGNHNIVYANCKGRFGVFDKRTGTERSYYVGAASIYGHNPADLRYRFQRVSPVHVSPHNPDMVYHGSQYVHRTLDDGVTWETISPDLTAFEADKQVDSGSPITRDITGEEFYSTIYSLRESPVQAGVIWVGSNDGPVHVTRDGGESWTDVTPRGLPKGGRVDSVEPSPHDPAEAYIAVLRYQLGDYKPYAYRTTDYGKSWTLLTDGKNGIPADYPVRVVREDPERPGLLFAGTEYGIYVSFDDGGSWQSFQQNLPVTPVTDIKIHRGDLVLSTMGRAFWVLDDVATLRQAPLPSVGDEPVLFSPDMTVRYRQTFRNRDPEAVPQYPTPAAYVDYYLPEDFDGSLSLEVLDADGELINAFSPAEKDAEEPAKVVEDMMLNEVRFLETDTLTADSGLNRFAWDMRYRGAWHKDEDERFSDGPLVAPGDYHVRLTVNDTVLEQAVTIAVDPRVADLGVTEDDIAAQTLLQKKVLALLDSARRTAQALHVELDALDDDEARRATLKATLAELETPKGTYMPAKLIGQIGYLYRMLDHADQAPGNEALDRYAVLQQQYQDLLSSVSMNAD
ncbi:MAG: WD40/YVTN/BNR-like repeat-containing protein [Congregibacter sp.]